MSAIVMRSFAEHMGITWPEDVAMRVSDYRGGMRSVTWAEVHEERRKRQARRLEWIRRPAEPCYRPCYVWTFFNRQMIPYHGWHCYIVTLREEIPVTFRSFKRELAVSIMREIPLGMLPFPENFEAWMAELARRHPRRKHRRDKRKAGSIVGWLKVHRYEFSLTPPSDLGGCHA